MSGEGYLVDSVILIDHFNAISAATDFLRDHRDEIRISVITRAEVLAGFTASKARRALALLDKIPLLAIDRAIADAAASLRRKHRWRLPDAFQAAIAGQHRLRLVTRDTRDFPPSRHDFVLVPYEV